VGGERMTGLVISPTLIDNPALDSEAMERGNFRTHLARLCEFLGMRGSW